MKVETAALGLVGSATTMLARAVTRKAMHKDDGAPRLPRTARHSPGMGMFLAIAAATGVMLALADVLQEQRRRSAQAATA